MTTKNDLTHKKASKNPTNPCISLSGIKQCYFFGRDQVELRPQDPLEGGPGYVCRQRGGNSHRVRGFLGAGEDGHGLDPHRGQHPKHRHRFADCESNAGCRKKVKCRLSTRARGCFGREEQRVESRDAIRLVRIYCQEK